MTRKQSKIWTNMAPRTMDPKTPPKEVFDRYIIGQVNYDINDTLKAQEEIKKNGMYKQYDGYKSRELKFISTYSNAVISRIRALAPNFYVQTQTSSIDENGKYNFPSLLFLLGFREGEQGPNGQLENTIRTINEGDILDFAKKNMFFPDYTGTQFAIDLKFAKNNLRESSANTDKPNLFLFRGVCNTADLGNKTLRFMYGDFASDARLNIRKGLYLVE